MADNNITGFKKLIRYAENLAEYEKGIADGIIDENVFVIVLAEKVAKFKGQTFDWSGGLETADEWKSPVCVTPEAQVPLTLESKFRMTPIKS